MHTLSKVLLGFVAVLAIVAMFLTSMLFDARNEWLKRVTERQEKIAKLEEDVRKKSLVVTDLQNEVNRIMSNWGRSWEVQPQNVSLLDAESGTVSLGIGLSNGFAVRENAARQADPNYPYPTIHLFGASQDGASNYLGAFQVTEVQGELSAAQLIRRPLPGEVNSWQELAAGGVRVWNNVPSHWLDLNVRYQGQIAEARQDVVDMEAKLATLDVLIAKSQNRLARRMAELEGDDDPVAGASQDVIVGLVQTLRNEDTERNQQLQVLDQLRHEYHAKYNALIDLLEQNRNLENQLPQPTNSSEPSLIQPTAGRLEESSTTR
ncbi:MAG: hypothetical protein KDA93_21740 [Planctomycetaceae bacterium]|nr:hypothetical protein [Planctomycetaceae bacterium]